MRPTLRPIARAGFTLLEIMVVVMILSAVIVMATTSLDTGSKLSERMTIENDLATKANRVLNKLALELRTVEADPDTLKMGTTYETSAGATYQYRTAEGIVATNVVDEDGVPHQSFTTQFETATYHELVYAKAAGTLTRNKRSNAGVLLQSEILCDQIRTVSSLEPCRSGFFIDQVGNTLAMELVLEQTYRAGHKDERVVHVADAQVLFLRATLNTNTGSCPYSANDEAEILEWSVYYPYPQIVFGHRLTWVSSTPVAGLGLEEQISINIQPPVGYELETQNGNWVYIYIESPYDTGRVTFDAYGEPMAEYNSEWDWIPKYTEPPLPAVSNPTRYNRTTTDGVLRFRDLIRDDRPSINGNYTITLTGQIEGPIIVWCYAQTKNYGGMWIRKSF